MQFSTILCLASYDWFCTDRWQMVMLIEIRITKYSLYRSMKEMYNINNRQQDITKRNKKTATCSEQILFHFTVLGASSSISF